MFVAGVVIGEGEKLVQDDQTLTSPPNGKDSVLGEVGVHQSLNYDEVTVYVDDAALPKYLILFK